MESTPGEDALQIVEVTTKDLDYYINFVEEAASGFARIFSFERSAVGKIPSKQQHMLQRHCS